MARKYTVHAQEYMFTLVEKNNQKIVSPFKGIPEPLAHGVQTLPSHRFILISHEFHDSCLQAQALQLPATFWNLLHEVPYVVAGNSEHLLIVVPALGEDLDELLGQRAVGLLNDPSRILLPESQVLVGRRPAQVARLNLGGILVKRRLGLGVLLQHRRECSEILEQVGVGEVAAGQVGEQGGESNEDGDGEQSCPVCGAKAVQSCEEQTCGLFLRRETQELGVKLDNFIFPRQG